MSRWSAAWGSVRLVAAKDLRIERRSRTVLFQIVPFAMVVLVVFAFALDAKAVTFVDTPSGARRSVGLLPLVAPGLIWLAVLFALLLMVQRSFAIEAEDGAIDALRLAGIGASWLYWGKVIAITVQLLGVAMITTLVGLVLYDVSVPVAGFGLLLVTTVLSTVAFSVVGTLYGAFTLRNRSAALLSLLVFPATAPIMIAGTRATESAFGTDGLAVAEGWPWIGLLAVYTLVLGVGSSLAFGPLTEEAL